MNHIADEILSYYGVCNDESMLEHYGMPRRSGRYPWGSGENPYQSSQDFMSRIKPYKDAGMSDGKIAEKLGISSSELRQEISICKDQRMMANIHTAERLRDKEGMNTSQIGRKMGVNESTVRNWFENKETAKFNETKKTVEFLKEQCDNKKMIDVGKGVDKELNISRERLNTAIYFLTTREGYHLYTGGVKQVTNPSQQTVQKVLCVPGTEHKDIYEYDKIKTITEYSSNDYGGTFKKFQYPASMDSKRLQIRYAEDGGEFKDGIVEIRRGVSDLSLGNDRYSQVRILVDGKKYIKGVAVYSDDMPKGVDVIFNTNKTKKTDKMDVLKDIKSDPDNPFGALIKANGQSTYTDKNGKEQLSLINKTRGEGDWTDWTDSLPSQFLSKQSLSLAKRQLGIAKSDKVAEFEEYKSLTNPTIKKYYLDKFADSCDSAAVNLKAAALPGQKYHVMIPINSLKDHEIFAPQYANGTKLALIRYPHGGTFEIPILTVNNKNADASKIIGKDSIDAVGITKKNADRLSGADFDGDTVMCIPTGTKSVNIISTPELSGLKGFDPKLKYGPESYAGREVKLMKDPVKGTDNTQKEMGSISNLITDMTLDGGATEQEMARAVRHSMVVIDAAKHKLDYKQSEIDNNIKELREKYQVKVMPDGTIKYGGASTLISRAKGETNVPKRQGSPMVNLKDKPYYDPTKPEGAKIYKTADDLYYPVRKYDRDTHIMTLWRKEGGRVEYNVADKKAEAKYSPVKVVDSEGKVTYKSADGTIEYKIDYRKQKSTNMSETTDARTLISEAKHPVEIVYADYANYMKDLANKARIESANTGNMKYDRKAKEVYRGEVRSLLDKLDKAELNAVKEREANRRANVEVNIKKEADPTLKNKDIKKLSQQAITKYREEVGSVSRRDRNIEITDREWTAIQAGAVTEATLKRILSNSDPDSLRDRAMPKQTKEVSAAKIARISALRSSGLTLKEIADATGLSSSTVSKYLKGEK